MRKIVLYLNNKEYKTFVIYAISQGKTPINLLKELALKEIEYKANGILDLWGFKEKYKEINEQLSKHK